MALKKNDVVSNSEKTKKKPNGCAIIVAILVFGLAFGFLSAKNIADDVDVLPKKRIQIMSLHFFDTFL